MSRKRKPSQGWVGIGGMNQHYKTCIEVYDEKLAHEAQLRQELFDDRSSCQRYWTTYGDVYPSSSSPYIPTDEDKAQIRRMNGEQWTRDAENQRKWLQLDKFHMLPPVTSSSIAQKDEKKTRELERYLQEQIVKRRRS